MVASKYTSIGILEGQLGMREQQRWKEKYAENGDNCS